MTNLLKVKDICDLLKVSKSTVYKWVNEGFLPYIVIKRNKRKQTIRFNKDAIESWMKEQKRETRRVMKAKASLNSPQEKTSARTTSEGKKGCQDERREENP